MMAGVCFPPGGVTLYTMLSGVLPFYAAVQPTLPVLTAHTVETYIAYLTRRARVYTIWYI